MPSRWVVCPVITDNGVRKPKVSIITDSGREPVFDVETQTFRAKTFRYSSAVSGRDWALCFVTGENLENLTNDPDVVDLFETDFDSTQRENLLGESPRSKGWTRAQIDKIAAVLGEKSVSAAGITADTTFEEILFRLGDIHADTGKRGRFSPRRVWAR